MRYGEKAGNLIIVTVCLISLLLLITPISAEMVSAKVDDKGLIYCNGYGLMGTVHTEYGTIIVNNNDYNNIKINGTIKYDTDIIDSFWSNDLCWDVVIL